MTVKTGIFALPASVNSNLDGIDYVRSLGAAAFEPFASKDLASPDHDAAIRIRDAAQEAGIALPCLSMGANLSSPGGDAEVERLKQYAEVARIMGIPYLHHTLFPVLNPAERRPFDELLAGVASRAREVFDFAADLGVQCVYEDQGFAFNGVANFRRFLDALDRPAGVVLDLGNTAFALEKPRAFAEAFAERIVHVHVKDYRILTSPEGARYSLPDGTGLAPAPLGEGDMNITAALEIVRKAGYNGWYMLENENLDEQPADLELLHALLGTR